MPSFRDLLVPLPGDFVRLATKQNLGLAVIGLGAAMASHPADNRLANALWANNGPNNFLAPGERAGGLALHAAGGFAAFLVGRATNNARLATVGGDVFRAQIVAQTTTHAIKFSAHRTRPDGTTHSFPSGHTSSLFATATVLQRDLGWRVGAPAYAIAAWVGVSRIENRRHYLSDVLAGATIGILAGRSVTVGSGAARFAIAPMAANGGVGVSFTKVGK